MCPSSLFFDVANVLVPSSATGGIYSTLKKSSSSAYLAMVEFEHTCKWILSTKELFKDLLGVLVEFVSAVKSLEI